MREDVLGRALRFEERSELERWSGSGDDDLSRRANIILLASEGRSIREIGESLGSNPINVRKWVQRFNESGLDGLSNHKRGPKKGVRSRFRSEQERAILDLASRTPRELGYNFDRWSPQKLADAAVARGIVAGISHVTVRAMLRDAGLGAAVDAAPDRTVVSVEPEADVVEPSDPPRSTSALIEAGEAALNKGNNREGATRLREALEQPGLAPATEALIRCRLTEALEGLASHEEALEIIRPYEDPALKELLPPALRGRVKLRLGWAYSWLHNFPRAIARLNEASKIFMETEDQEGLAEAHYALGRTYMEFKESSMARDHLERALALQRYPTNRHFLAQVYLRRGTVEFDEGYIAKATGYWERALELAEGSSDDNLLGLISMNLGVARIHADRGERDRATHDLERAILHYERGGHRAFLALAYNNLGDNLRFAGDWTRSIDCLERSLALAREANDPAIIGMPLITLGEIAFRRGRYEEAEGYLNEALELLRGIEDHWSEPYALRILGGVYYALQQPERALETLRDTLRLATLIKDLRGVTVAHLLLAELHIALKRYEQAEEYIELARGALNSDPSQLRSSGLARRLGGRLDLAFGRYAEAQQQIAQSVSIFMAVADLYEVAISHLDMGDLLVQIGDEVQGRQHLDQAATILRQLGAAPDLARAEALQHGPRKAEVPAGEAVEPRAGHTSDVLLMQRLIDASASRELLLQELVSIVEENFSPGRILLLVKPGDGEPHVELALGFDPEEAAAQARKIAWALAADAPLSSGILYQLDDRTGNHAILYLETLPPASRLRPLLRQVELGLENCALRDASRRVAEPAIEHVRVETVIPGFIFAGEAMRAVIERIHKIRTSDVTVLITGESGTGKELVARAIHAGSERRRAAFLPFNCTATPKEIIDSQLFGHRRGAFTGATSNYPGITRAAEGGTLFLDEIGDLALEVQPKLLRFLESGEIQPLGETKPSKVDVRVVAATNMDLERAVDEGRFREDLFHRLDIIRIHVPPLRERREEIPVLADFFLKHFSARSGKGTLALSDDAMEILTVHPWPGNVRQLRNEMERVAAYTAPNARVGVGDLSPELSTGRRFSPQPAPADPRWDGNRYFGGQSVRRGETNQLRSAENGESMAYGQTLKQATTALERHLIDDTLAKTGNDLAAAARVLGLSLRGLHLKMSQLGIERADLA